MSAHEQTDKTGKRPRWGMAAALAVAAALFGTAGALTLRTVSGDAPAKTAAGDGAERVPSVRKGDAVMGRKTPTQLGYPALPGAYRFQSTEAPNGTGSAAYMVPHTTSPQVVEFYRKKLTESGWKFRSQQKTSMRPAGQGKGPLFQGQITRWASAEGTKGLVLWALDDPQHPGGAQVLLTWEPLRKGP